MSSVFSFPASHPSLVACQTRRPYCPLLIHHWLLPFPLTNYSLKHPDLSFLFFVFCFFSHCLAAPLGSSPPRHMQVHGRQVHPSPRYPIMTCKTRPDAPAALSHQHLQEVLAVLRSSSPYHYRYCFTTLKPVAAASTLHMGVRHPISARKTHHDATTQCHHSMATTPRVIPLQHQLDTVRRYHRDRLWPSWI
ncbi:hypothetical protein EDB83DRAFT_2358893, partial [Lactarius deliciosus]